jgi:hypothetical protein
VDSGGRCRLLPRVGNGRKLPRFCGKCGFRAVECGKCEICKQRNSLFLRLFEPGLLKWGSGGRWFESSRPDIARPAAAASCGRSFLFGNISTHRATRVGRPPRASKANGLGVAITTSSIPALRTNCPWASTWVAKCCVSHFQFHRLQAAARRRNRPGLDKLPLCRRPPGLW